MAKKTYRKFSKKGLSKKNKLRKSKRKSLRSKRKSRKHGGYGQLASSGPEIKKSYLTYGHLPCDTTNKFQNFLCELAKYYYYKMNKGDKARTKEEDHKQKLIARELRKISWTVFMMKSLQKTLYMSLQIQLMKNYMIYWFLKTI